MENSKFTIIGAGFVGMSMAAILAKYHQVNILDNDKIKVDLINASKSPLSEPLMEKQIVDYNQNIFATTNFEEAISDANFIIISLPTNFNEVTNSFDTNIIESMVEEIVSGKTSPSVIIKSTIPIGFTERLNKQYKNSSIFFSPEFLREGSAIEDNLYPSRIIVGGKTEFKDEMANFAECLKSCSLNDDTPVHIMSSQEAEAVKLFSNTYLAMRVAFFNELDSFSVSKNLDTLNIIRGISDDKRIGGHYNNPSFGYGGYCLPKDTKQLLSNFENIPQKLISSIVKSNETRKEYLANEIINKDPKIIGIYRLIMKDNSENFRNSAILDILKILKDHKKEIIIYEPLINEYEFHGCKIENNLSSFKEMSSIILANRLEENIEDVNSKVFTRDLFNKD
ncbi:nucleotide sugar dehydrogenase [Gammaproteobacteria bacterium]|nr:nucleotide sugar dehydrogenase [Gammaproteobacteria bacterium]